MEILKLKPAFKDYLWGGHRLVEEYNKVSDLDKVAESWELSNHKDGSSIIANGKDAGKTFAAYLAEKGKVVWGKNCAKFDHFPILIKFIDAKQALSIQVHPDDEYAYAHEGESGKNEFWYILDAQPGAFLYYGVKEIMTPEAYRESIENDTVCDYLKKVEVKKGDCFFIKAGTIHAIGAGIVICEIQQSSNSTYRVYDFGRVGVDGKPRPLHIDKAVDVSNLTPSGKNGETDGEPIDKGAFVSTLLTSNDYFTCTKLDIRSEKEFCADNESFNSLIVLEGNGTIIGDNQTIEVQKGDSIFVPAGYGKYCIRGELSIILSVL